jgi:hypothetical protein
MLGAFSRPAAPLTLQTAFARTTALAYSWADAAPDDDSPAVEAGVNDHLLDRLYRPDDQFSCSPVIELTSDQVAEQVQLIRTGLLGKGE